MGLKVLAAPVGQCGLTQHVAWNVGAQVFPEERVCSGVRLHALSISIRLQEALQEMKPFNLRPQPQLSSDPVLRRAP